MYGLIRQFKKRLFTLLQNNAEHILWPVWNTGWPCTDVAARAGAKQYATHNEINIVLQKSNPIFIIYLLIE